MGIEFSHLSYSRITWILKKSLASAHSVRKSLKDSHFTSFASKCELRLQEIHEVWVKIDMRHFWVVFVHCVEKPQKILGGIVFATVYCCWHMTKVFAILFYATMPISFAKITKRLPQNLMCLKDWISLCKISLKLRRASVENDWTRKSTKFKSSLAPKIK